MRPHPGASATSGIGWLGSCVVGRTKPMSQTDLNQEENKGVMCSKTVLCAGYVPSFGVLHWGYVRALLHLMCGRLGLEIAIFGERCYVHLCAELCANVWGRGLLLGGLLLQRVQRWPLLVRNLAGPPSGVRFVTTCKLCQDVNCGQDPGWTPPTHPPNPPTNISQGTSKIQCSRKAFPQCRH